MRQRFLLLLPQGNCAQGKRNGAPFLKALRMKGGEGGGPPLTKRRRRRRRKRKTPQNKNIRGSDVLGDTRAGYDC